MFFNERVTPSKSSYIGLKMFNFTLNYHLIDIRTMAVSHSDGRYRKHVPETKQKNYTNATEGLDIPKCSVRDSLKEMVQ